MTTQGRRATTPPPPLEQKAKPLPAVIGIDDEGFRRVFEHLERYGSVNESELVQILGTPRKVRAFSLQFEDLVRRVKFRVRIDTAGTMKCYVKEGK